jgi:hypothetical protein
MPRLKADVATRFNNCFLLQKLQRRVWAKGREKVQTGLCAPLSNTKYSLRPGTIGAKKAVRRVQSLDPKKSKTYLLGIMQG